TALCPFHNDEHPSFSVFQKNGVWFHKCFAGCSSGDEIAFLVKHFNIPRREAIKRYLEMAGFPPRSQAESREYPKCHVFPGSPMFPVLPVSPVSEGQTVAVIGVVNELHAELKALAARYACTGSTRPEDSSWQLARHLKAVAKALGRKLDGLELNVAFDTWRCLSRQFLDPEKTGDAYWIGFLAQLQKARVPMGEGRIAEAREYGLKLTE